MNILEINGRFQVDPYSLLLSKSPIITTPSTPYLPLIKSTRHFWTSKSLAYIRFSRNEVRFARVSKKRDEICHAGWARMMSRGLKIQPNCSTLSQWKSGMNKIFPAFYWYWFRCLPFCYCISKVSSIKFSSILNISRLHRVFR